MSNSRIPSPARSQSAVVTPRRYKPRRTLSVGSPARSTASGRLSAIIQLKEIDKNSFVLSPIPTRRSVLNDDTNIEEPRRRSWWKKLDNSRDVMEVLNDNKILETNEVVEEFIDIEVLSQERKNYSLDLPESSDSESISSIVIPQRKLFTQKDMQSQDKFAPLMGTRETLAKLHKSVAHDKTIHVPPKNLFNQPSKPKPRPVFPADLLNISPNKTVNKTKELTTVQVTGQTRNLFGNRPGTKRKNMFSEFIMSESEDELSEIQPKVFGFNKKVDQQKETSTSHRREPSPTSNITADIEMDDWKLLPSSTMVENQLEDMMAAAKSPARRTRLSQLSELLESDTEAANTSINKRRQSNKSMSKNKSKVTVEPNNEPEVDKSALLRNKLRKSPNKSEQNRSTRKSKTNTPRAEVNKPEEINEILNSDPLPAKRLRLSNSPEKIITSKSVKNASLNESPCSNSNKSETKNLSIISSGKQNNENDAEKSILTRSKTKNISNNSLQSDDRSIEQESNNDAQEPNNESNEDDELNMSLVYDEHDEIDCIKANQNENSCKADANEKSLKNLKHNKKNEEKLDQDSLPISKDITQTEGNHGEKVNSPEIESNNVDMKQGYALNKNDKVIAEVTDEGQKESSTEDQNDPIEKVENVNNEEDRSDKESDTQDEHQAAQSENDEENQSEVGKLNGEESREDNNDNNQEVIESDVIEDQDDEINQDISQERDQDVSQEGDQEREEEMETDDNIEAKDESQNASQYSDNESLAKGNDEQENEKSQEIEEDDQEINDEEQEKSETVELEQEVDEVEENYDELHQENEEIAENEEKQEIEGKDKETKDDKQEKEETVELDQEVDEVEEIAENNEDLEQDSEEIKEDNDEVEQESEEENEELENTNLEAGEDSEELEETDHEVEVDNEESEEIDREIVESDEEPENVSQEEDEQDSDQEIVESDQEPENVSQEEQEELDQSQELEESQELDQNDSNEEIEGTNEDVETNGETTRNHSHDTTGRHRQNIDNKIDSPEVILHDKTKQLESFTAKGRNTSLRRTSIMKNMNIRPSLAPPRDSTGFSDGGAEGSGWDSHRTTRKTLRQTFGKDFTPRKSLRALVMEKSAKRQTVIGDLTTVTSKFPQANSTELPEASNIHDANDSYDAGPEPVHDISKRTRQTTLEAYLQKIKKQNMEKRMKIEENVKNSLKAPIRDISNTFKVPSKPMFAVRKSNTRTTQQKKAKQIKSTLIPLDDLPPEVIEDMKYKPPRRYQPSNAAWITKRLYKFLETKLEPKYDYKARIRAEKLVEAIYQFAKELRRHPAASSDSIDSLKHEMARLDVVKTHFDFYQFFHEYMPREIRIKVIPDVMNKLPLPRHGVFSEILRVNTIQG